MITFPYCLCPGATSVREQASNPLIIIHKSLHPWKTMTLPGNLWQMHEGKPFEIIPICVKIILQKLLAFFES